MIGHIAIICFFGALFILLIHLAHEKGYARGVDAGTQAQARAVQFRCGWSRREAVCSAVATAHQVLNGEKF